MKKLLLFLLLGIFMINIVSAVDWDNTLTYGKEDKVVLIENLFGLPLIGTELASIEIISHKSLDKPISIYGLGYQEVMRIEVDSKEDYLDFIKGVEFINMKTNSYEELDYYWEISTGLKNIEVDNEKVKECGEDIYTPINNSWAENCYYINNGTHTEEIIDGWERIEDSKDIKKGEFTLRLIVWINRGDYYDGIPELFGKKISNWALWENPIIDAHGQASGISDSGTDARGWVITTKHALNISEIGFSTGITCTEVYIRNYTNYTLIYGNTTITNYIANFGNIILLNNTNYTIDARNYSSSCGGDGYALGGVIPIDNTNIKWVRGIDSNGDLKDTWGWYIVNITSETEASPTVSLTINYPTETTYNTQQTELNYTATSEGTLDSCWYSLNLGETNSTRQNCNTNWTGLSSSEESNTWTIYGNITTGEMKNTTVTFSVDTIFPTVNITYPNGTIDYHSLGQNLSLNWNVSDINLGSCWYDWNGINTTVTCGNNQSYLNITDGSIKSLIFYVNDTSGNWNSSTTTWNYRIFENSKTFTESLFETETTTYSINVTANSSLTGIKLFYNNESGVAMTNQGSNYWNYSRDVPIGNASFDFYFNFTYAAEPYSSGNSTQEVNLTYFTLTDATYTDVFLNISFQDENSLVAINASIPYSSFIYYLGSGSVNKTLEFTNNTDNLEYTFSGTTGSKDLYVIPNVQYRRVSDYPQRIWTPTTRTYTTTQTNQTLYLASSTDGIYVTYQVVTSGEITIEGVEVTATRVVSGETIQVGAGTTDAAGTVTFWLNPDFQHIVTFIKTGYDNYVFTHFPTQASYTITMGSTTEEEEDCIRGITQTIRPSFDFLWVNETYNFNYTIDSSYWDLTEISFTLLDSNGASLGSNSSTSSSGGIISLSNINVSSYSTITMTYFYEIDGDCGQITGTRVWVVQSSTGTEYSIWQLTEDLNTYTLSGLFGFDDFGKTLLSFIIIVLMVGGLSRRYGIMSEGAIMGILFGTVFILDVGLGFIPRVQIGSIVSVEHFFTIITFIILFIIIIQEERR